MAKTNGASSAVDRLPPHAPEMERCVLSCILQSSSVCAAECIERFRGRSDVFYDLRHRTLMEAMMAMHRAGDAIEVSTVHQHLQDEALLDDAGGLNYLMTLPDVAPSTANLAYYLEQVLAKYRARKLIAYCAEVSDLAFDSNGNLEMLLNSSLRRFQSIADESLDDALTIRYLDAMTFDVDNDPNNVLGVHDGKTTRFLCRGHSAWLIGPSGIGKSSLLMLIAVSCCLGIPFFGVKPQRPLRVLMVQAENDIGDLAEMLKGVSEGLHLDFDDASQQRLQNYFCVTTCTGRTGQSFCEWLERQIISSKSEIVFVDPLLSFAGVEVGRQEQASKLCREWLDPILKRTGAVLISNHHTGKPEKGNGKQIKPQSIYDLMYSGLGSSELVNWSRAVLILQPTAEGENRFRLTFAKRGNRAWALQPNGDFTLTVWLAHSAGKIFWEQVDPPVEAEPSERSKGGKPNDRERIASMNLFEFCSQCKTEGEGLNEIAKRLECWLATQDDDVKLSTCKRIIPLLVSNKKLSKGSDGLYRKGTNA